MKKSKEILLQRNKEKKESLKSKAQKKKLQKIIEKKEKLKNRDELLKKIQMHAVDKSVLVNLKPSSKIGQV
jgi:hypothetical protein